MDLLAWDGSKELCQERLGKLQSLLQSLQHIYLKMLCS